MKKKVGDEAMSKRSNGSEDLKRKYQRDLKEIHHKIYLLMKEER